MLILPAELCLITNTLNPGRAAVDGGGKVAPLPLMMLMGRSPPPLRLLQRSPLPLRVLGRDAADVGGGADVDVDAGRQSPLPLRLLCPSTLPPRLLGRTGRQAAIAAAKREAAGAAAAGAAAAAAAAAAVSCSLSAVLAHGICFEQGSGFSCARTSDLI